MTKIKRTLYDCLNAKVLGDRISCSKGHKFDRSPEKGYLNIRQLIRGKPLSVTACQDCLDFDEMDGGPVLPEDRGWEKITRKFITLKLSTKPYK